MTNDKKHLEEEKKCKRCGYKLYSHDSIEAGYCIQCASHDKDARRAWEDRGFAKFCSCGQMLHLQDSIYDGKCLVCRKFPKKTIWKQLDNYMLEVYKYLKTI